MSVEFLINRIQAYNSDVDFEFLQRSYEFGEKAHKEQWRQSGEAYFTHCIATANILAELKLDTRTICAGCVITIAYTTFIIF